MANDNPSFFRRIDSAYRLGGSARIRLAYSADVLTDYQANNKVVSEAIFQRGENWLMDIDSSFSESEGSFQKKLDAIGYKEDNSVKLLIDEEAMSLKEFAWIFFGFLEQRNLYVEIILNNGSMIRLDNIQIDFNYSLQKNIASENTYEISLRQAKAIPKTIDFIQSVTAKQAIFPLVGGGTMTLYNVIVETMGDKSLYEVLLNTVDDIDTATLKPSMTFVVENTGWYFVFVRLKNSKHYQSDYIEITNS